MTFPIFKAGDKSVLVFIIHVFSCVIRFDLLFGATNAKLCTCIYPMIHLQILFKPAFPKVSAMQILYHHAGHVASFVY